jgi:hypothetical protein
MQLIQNPWVWFAGIAALAFVLWFALRQNKGTFGLDTAGFKVKVDKNGIERRDVSVARRAIVKGTVGNITGVEGTSELAANRAIDVAAGAEITGSAGDVTGIKESGRR